MLDLHPTTFRFLRDRPAPLAPPRESDVVDQGAPVRWNG